MAAASTRVITINFTGDISGTETPQAASNAAAPAQIQVVTLSAGDNTFTLPTGGTTPVAVTIMKPAGNTQLIKLKGAGGDTGTFLHKTDPDSISLDATAGSLILNAAGTVTGLRLIWS